MASVSPSSSPTLKRDPKIQQDLGLGLGIFGSIVLIGTLWYHWVERWPWIEALYMTVITLTTVGFMEVKPLGHRGRLFTIALNPNGGIEHWVYGESLYRNPGSRPFPGKHPAEQAEKTNGSTG